MIKKWLRSPIVSGVLFVLAAALILFGGIRGVQAAPRIQSRWFGAQVELDDIDVALTEANAGTKGSELRHGRDALLTGMVPEGQNFQVGTTYTEQLAVRNTVNANSTKGNVKSEEHLINEFVRVTVYKYWVRTDEKGNITKAYDLDPNAIKIEFAEDGDWAIDTDSSTPERTVLYYGSILKKGQDSSPFTKSVTIDSSVASNKAYKDATFRIEAVVDAVQTHNGEDAMKSAWGKAPITVGADAEE